jgi:hypothetical protein
MAATAIRAASRAVLLRVRARSILVFATLLLLVPLVLTACGKGGGGY